MAVSSAWPYRRANNHAVRHRVLLAVVMPVAVHTLSGTAYPICSEGALFVCFPLGPAAAARRPAGPGGVCA